MADFGLGTRHWVLSWIDLLRAARPSSALAAAVANPLEMAT